jgi:hypothetical protein
LKKEVSFTYEVTWTPTDFPFERRFDIYLESNFFENGIHWFSILNSFVMVLVLVLVVWLIMR